METRNFIFLTLLLFTLSSCKYHEGLGGKHFIQGKILVMEYDASYKYLRAKYYSPNENVFIIYGNNPTYGEKLESGFDGTYQFRYLQKGHYKVYAFSKDTTFTTSNGLVPVIKDIEIKSSDKTVIVPDLIIIK
ncbi:MAG TPA: hypothetical protein VNW99_11100 [Cytophagaceae bacterium]|nr:hypothetical protein [Cytophagaceae bacterium]